jgi:hypothetical protein
MRARFHSILASILFIVIALVSPPSAEAAVYSNVGIVTSGLKMYFDPDNPNGFSSSTVLRDLSGNGFDGTLTKTGSWPDLQTSQGRYLGFDGAGGYVDLPDINSPSNWSGLTFTFYANFGGGAGSFERIFDFGNGPNSNNIIVGREGTSGTMFIEIYRDGASGGYCRSAANSITSGTWDHWAITMNGTTCAVYKNNSLNNSQAYTYLPWARNLVNNYIGKSNWADAAFEGGISNLAIYDRALSSSELTQNYNAQTDITAPAVSGNFLGSPENQLNVSTLNLETGATYTKLTGLDAGKLNISSSGVIAFLTNPNYEARDSANGTFQYQINVRAVDTSGNYVDFVLQVTVTDVQESAAISLPSLSATPYKGVPLTITVTPSGDGTSIPGKVTFLIAGKRIPGCYKKSYSGSGNATCSWEPAMQGNREITATFTPTNTNFSAISSKKSFWISKRVTTR